MKVVLATPVPLGSGGLSRHVLDLAHGLDQMDVQVVLAIPGKPDGLQPQVRDAFDVVAFASPPPCDVWHLHLPNTFDRSAMAALLRSRGTAGCTVLTEHLPRTDASDPTVSTHRASRGAFRAKTLFKRLQYSRCARIFALSQGSARFLNSRYGIPFAKLEVIRNGVKIGDSAPPPPAGAGLFVALGSVIVQKGFDTLVDAAALAHEPWTVRVFGKGAHLQALSKRASHSTGRVVFEGWTHRTTQILESAHALVTPSRWEASPYIALEAMERGRAVIATQVDGLEDMVADNASGILVPPADPRRLAEALDLLTKRPALAAEFGRVGRYIVAESFHLDRMISETYHGYQRALAA